MRYNETCTSCTSLRYIVRYILRRGCLPSHITINHLNHLILRCLNFPSLLLLKRLIKWNRACSLDNLPVQWFLWDWQSFENCPLLIFKSNFTKRAESEDHLSGHKFLRDWKYFQKYSTYRYNLINRAQSFERLTIFLKLPLLICKCSRAHSLDNLSVHHLRNIYEKVG